MPLRVRATRSVETDTALHDDEGIAFRDSVVYNFVNV